MGFFVQRTTTPSVFSMMTLSVHVGLPTISRTRRLYVSRSVPVPEGKSQTPLLQSAVQMHEYYVVLQEAGFTGDEAIKIIVGILNRSE